MAVQHEHTPVFCVRHRDRSHWHAETNRNQRGETADQSRNLQNTVRSVWREPMRHQSDLTQRVSSVGDRTVGASVAPRGPGLGFSPGGLIGGVVCLGI